MPFHRLTIPGYIGGLPGTHDYINDPAANGDPGVPAPADGKKAFAPAPGDQNEGTYFVAFSEPAQAININRPANALAQNTDFLDDVIHRDLAIPAFFDVAAGHGGTISLALTGDVFVGTAGTPNNQGVRDQLIQIVNPVTGAPIVFQTASGPPAVYTSVAVFLVHDGSSNNVVGNGFYTNPTVDFAVVIPSATAFRVLFHVRGRVKDQPAGMLTRVRAEPIGLGGALASIQGILSNAAFKSASNTFAAGFTQTFAGPVTLAQTVALTMPGATPAFTNTLLSPNYVLIDEFNVSVYSIRRYKYSSLSTSFPSGFVLTMNARYQGGALPWIADAASYAATRIELLGSSQQSSTGKISIQSLPPGQSTWTEAAWVSVVGSVIPTSYLELINGSFLNHVISNNVPVLKSDSLVTGDPGDGTNNPYKLIFDFAAGAVTGSATRIRLYVGNDDTAGLAPKHFGNLLLTHNAVWNTITKQWSKDSTNKDSQALAFRAGSTGSAEYSGLTGSGIAGSIASHQATALMYLVKAPGLSTWSANGWLGSASEETQFGHLRIQGEYAYAAQAGGKDMVLWSDPTTWVGGAYWQLAINGVAQPQWGSSTANQFLHIPLVLPPHALITLVSVDVDPASPAAPAGQRMVLEAFEYEPNTGLSVVSLGTDEATSSTSPQTLSISTGSFPRQAGVYSRYYLRVRHSSTAGSELVLNARVLYKAPINVPGIGTPFYTHSP